MANDAPGHLVYRRWLLCHLLVIERPCRARNDAFCKFSRVTLALWNVWDFVVVSRKPWASFFRHQKSARAATVTEIGLSKLPAAELTWHFSYIQLSILRFAIKLPHNPILLIKSTTKKDYIQLPAEMLSNLPGIQLSNGIMTGPNLVESRPTGRCVYLTWNSKLISRTSTR